MTPDPLALTLHQRGPDILHLMLERRIGHLPVVQDGRLAGMITQTDLVRFQAASSAQLIRDAATADTVEDLAAHATEVWPESSAPEPGVLCLPIRRARRDVGRPRPISRKVVCDFDLLSKSRGERVADSRLDDLIYLVFDTETTGLLPRQGDEIVQITALRIVNGRAVDGEVVDTLANPGQSIPLSSTEVHGLTEAMVADAPDVDTALRRFHHFAEGAVLVAHNAPFDMEFQRRHEARLALRFDNPVLDTVLLSAVVFGQTEVHSLDALTHRLGIAIPEEERHAAIGGTRATADAFLRLVAMLQGRDMVTFGDVLSEVRRHGRLLADLNTEETLGVQAS